MQERAEELLAVTITLLVLGLVTVSLRCFVRIRLVKAFGLDDYLMVASMLVFAAFCACQITAIHYGMGSHNRDLSPPNIVQALKYQILCEVLYVADAALIKLSVAFLLLRIMPETVAKVYRRILFSCMTVMTLWTAVTFFILLFQCRPVSFAWDRSSGKGKCISDIFTTRTSYAFSAMDIILDWLFALLPVPMLWNVNMSRQLKGSLLIILGLGVFASTATIVRLKYLVALEDLDDRLYSIAQTLIWTVTEMGIGIVAASIATLRPLFKLYHIPGFSSPGSRDRSKPTVRSGYLRSYDLGYVHNTANAGESTTTTTTHGRTMSDGHTSVESIIDHGKGNNGISKRTDFEVSYEARNLEARR